MRYPTLSALLLTLATPALADSPPDPPPPFEVSWTCDGTRITGKTLRTRFEPGAVTVTWGTEVIRLDAEPSEVGARYATTAEGETAPSRFWLRSDGDHAVFEHGAVQHGCRSERRDPNLPAVAPAAQTPLAIAAALVETLPAALSGLEAIVGRLPRDPRDRSPATPLVDQRSEGPIASIFILYRIDIYHSDPRGERDPVLAGWDVSFRGDDGEAIEALLLSRYGEGRTLAHRPGAPLRFGPFYLDRGTGGSADLEWHEREPDWAVPPRTEGEERDEITRVERFLEAGITRASLEAAFGPLGPDSWQGRLEGETPHWRISAHPLREPFDSVSLIPRGTPIPAGSLISSLGVADPVVVSHDVHMSSRELEDRESGPPRVGRYEVEVEIDYRDLVDAPRSPGSFVPTWGSKRFPILAIGIRLPRR